MQQKYQCVTRVGRLLRLMDRWFNSLLKELEGAHLFTTRWLSILEVTEHLN